MKRSFRTDNAPLLKDYLLDDLNCSSSSFKSFPRTHCCTTIRFLVHEDLKSRRATVKFTNNVHKSRPRTTVASTAISALQKASEAVLNAVKLLSVPKRSSVKSGIGFLSRNLSRKVFWKKNVDEIHRWKTFHNLVSDFPETPSHCIPTPTTATTAVTVTTSFTQSTTIDDEDSKSSCCSDSEMSSEYVQSSRREEVSVKESRDRSGDEPGKDSNEPVEKKDWMATNEKEQFSPVSILESPFEAEDRDDNVSSPDLDSKLVGIEGTRKRLMETLSRFEALVEMEPIDLDERLAALSGSEGSKNNDITNLDSEKAQNMLELVKSRIMPAQFETRSVFFADSLLLDFFMESLQNVTDHELIEAAEGYLTGQRRKMVSDWRVDESRKWYLKEMEMGGNWKDFEQQRVELVMEIEGSIWSSLVNDLMNELNY
ncbi:unnamed protein product [Rhodiola kirilowii]